MSARLIPNEIVKVTGGRFAGGMGLTMIDGVCTDSRTATRNCLFVPLSGERRDGHQFINDAFKKGATATLVARSSGALTRLQKNWPKKIFVEVDDTLEALGDLARFWRHKIGAAAVIGTPGSAAILNIAAQILSSRTAVKQNPPGNGTLLGIPLCLLGLTAENGFVLLELDVDRPQDTKRLAEICMPSAAIVRADGPAAAALLKSLEPGSTAIVSVKDKSITKLAKESNARVLTCGNGGDLQVRNVSKTSFDLCIGAEQAHVTMATDDIDAALMAAALAWHIGMDAGKTGGKLSN